MPKNTTTIELILEDGQVIQAATRVNTALDGVHKKAESLGENHGFEKFTDAVKEFIENPLHTAADYADKFLKSLGPEGAAVAGAVGALGAIGAAGIEAMESLGSLARETENISLKTGLATKEVGQFAFAAKAAGGDMTTVERMMRGLTMAIEGTDPAAQKAQARLREMGINLEALRSGTASTSDVLLKISEHLNEMPNTWERNQVALDLFKRAGIDAIPVLMGLSENFEKARELGLGITDSELSKFKQYHEQLNEIGAEWDVLKRKMMEPIAGTVSVVLQWLTGSGDMYTANGKRYVQNASGTFVPVEPLSGPQTLNQFSGTHTALFSGYPQPNIHIINPGQDMIAADRAAWGRTLMGAESALQTAQKDAHAAEDSYFSAGENTPKKDLDDLRQAWQEAEAEVAKYKKTVDSLREAEGRARAAAMLHKPGDFVLHGAANYDSYEGAEGSTGYYEGVRPTAPTLFRPQELGYDSNWLNRPVDITAGGMTSEGLDAQMRMDAAKVQAEMRVIEMTDKEADAVEKIYRIRLATAMSQEDVQSAELQHALDLLKLQQQAEAEQKAALAAYKDDVLKAFDALQSRGRGGGLGGFFESQARGLERHVIGNFAGMTHDSVSGLIPDLAGDPNSFIGKLLAGTPFGAKPGDKLGGAGDKLNTAGDALLRAANALAGVGGPGGAAGGPLTASFDQYGNKIGVYGAAGWQTLAPYPLSPGGSGGGSDWGIGPGSDYGGAFDLTGGGSDSGVYSSLGTAQYVGGDSGTGSSFPSFGWQYGGTVPGSGTYGSTFAAGLARSAASAEKAIGGFSGNFGAGAVDPLGTIFGNTGDGVFGGYNQDGASTAQYIGAGAGLAAAGFAVYSGINQITQGGARNAIGGIGTIAGTAAMLDPEPISKAILMGVAVVSGIVTSIFGDPRKNRANQEQQFLEANAYSGPSPVSYTRDMNGNAVSYDLHGNVQPVVNVTNNIQALDAQSFSNYLQQPGPSQALDNGMYRVVQNGNKTVPALKSAILGV